MFGARILRITLAMDAGVSKTLWSVDDAVKQDAESHGSTDSA
jgi:hypothetical protein